MLFLHVEHAPAARQHAGKAAEAARAAAREAEERRRFARLRGGAAAAGSGASESAPHYGLDEPGAIAMIMTAASAGSTGAKASGHASASLLALEIEDADVTARLGLVPPAARFVAVMDAGARAAPPVVGYSVAAWGRGGAGGRVEPAQGLQ